MLLASQAYAVRLKAACIAAPSLSTHAHTRCSRTRSASHGSPIALTVTCSKQSQLPQELIKARQLKSTGLATSAVFIGTALTVATTQGVSLPSVPSWLIWGLLAVSTGVAGVLVVAAQEGLQYELHNGRLYIQWGSPSEGVPVAPEAIQVKSTEDGRGNGAFAAADIPEGAHIGIYEGELLDEAAYWERYPSGVSDYCIRIDREWSIDGCARAKDTSSFSPCHMNHSSTRCNVVRSTSRKDQRVSFFAAREIKAGSELLLDYGRMYWKTRQDQLID